MYWIQIILALAVSLVAAGFDWRRQVIPNRLTYSAVLVGLVLSLFGGWIGLKSSLLGIGAVGGLFFVCWLFHAVGAGDVKLMAAMGSLLGMPTAWTLLFFTALTGGLVAILYVIWAKSPASDSGTEDVEMQAGTAPAKQSRWKRRMPYAPAVALGMILTLLLG